MKAAVITFPGSNNDDDVYYCLKQCVGFTVDKIWHKEEKDLSAYQLVVLPGGFSYGDYLRCGAIAALSPIMNSIHAFADKGGFILGTCNGFQILCEAKLLPGALVLNEGRKFLSRSVSLSIKSNNSPWSCDFKVGDKISLPIAHGEGRYVADETVLEDLEKNDQILLTYDGTNPNGSLKNIAGICNQRRNIFGLMPHPERATDLGSRDGEKFWKSVTHSLQSKT
jgi:phosphoribosylformylglycinamidine synthase